MNYHEKKRKEFLVKIFSWAGSMARGSSQRSGTIYRSFGTPRLQGGPKIAKKAQK